MEVTTWVEALRCQRVALGDSASAQAATSSERHMRYSAYGVLCAVPRYALLEPYPLAKSGPGRVLTAHNGGCSK